MPALGLGLSIYKSNNVFGSLGPIVSSVKTRLTASGVSVGRMLCLSGYINCNISGNTLSETVATELWLRLQAAGIVTSNNSCITNYLSNLTGEN